MKIWAILLAAGKSSRLSKGEGFVPKQFLQLDGTPLFWHGVEVFSRIAAIEGIVLVMPQQVSQGIVSAFGGEGILLPAEYYSVLVRNMQHDHPEVPIVPLTVVLGGNERQQSVCNGLAALPESCEAVLVHDVARPFASPQLISSIANELKQGKKAVIPAIDVTDTIKQIDAGNTVVHTPDRSCLKAVQTPQGFMKEVLVRAHAHAVEHMLAGTDDAQLVELLGERVSLIQGEEKNLKITVAKDLDLLCASEHALISGKRSNYSMKSALPSILPCTGFGYDVHRYGGERPFILGGVPIPCAVTIAAHSDGDTLLHALIDAILGCIGGGDIGTLFPDTSADYEGIESGILLAEVMDKAAKTRLEITHVDITIIAQVPKIAPHREAIERNVAKLLHLPPSYVCVKATTEEHLGFTGEKKGIKVVAVVSALKRREASLES